MKRYLSCLFLLLAVSVSCGVAGFTLRLKHLTEESVRAAESSLAEREQQLERMTEGVPTANREEIRAEHPELPAAEVEYYLMCEAGFLLVFRGDRETICLYTHIPITDLPVEERDKLRDGIGFSSMIEVMNYLESYTS
jgi:hypothetical protein